MANTAQEVLIAELLGDVGKLHDQVKALPEAFKETVTPTLGALALAVKDAKTSIEQAGKAEKAAFGNFTAQEKVALRDSLKAALREEAGAALADVARELSSSARLHKDAAQAESRQRWQWLAVALAVGLLGGALGFYGSHLLYGQQQAEQAAFGRAVISAWGDLDAKAKDRIQKTRENTQ